MCRGRLPLLMEGQEATGSDSVRSPVGPRSLSSNGWLLPAYQPEQSTED